MKMFKNDINSNITIVFNTKDERHIKLMEETLKTNESITILDKEYKVILVFRNITQKTNTCELVKVMRSR